MKRIFLVEDDRTISRNLTLLLKSEGFAVSHASTQADTEDSRYLSDGVRRRGQCGHRTEYGGGRLYYEAVQAAGTDRKDRGGFAHLQSEIVKMTLRIREQNAALRKEKKHLADSLADISHQLRTPLTSVNIILSLLEKDMDRKEQKSQVI